MCVRTHTHTHTHALTHAHAHTHSHTCMHACTCVITHTQRHTHTQACTHTHARGHTHTHTLLNDFCRCAALCSGAGPLRPRGQILLLGLCLRVSCVGKCVFVCVWHACHTHTHTHTHTHAYAHINALFLSFPPKLIFIPPFCFHLFCSVPSHCSVHSNGRCYKQKTCCPCTSVPP